MATSGEGEGEGAVKSSGGPTDYPCVKRLRHRRLLSYLQDQGLHGTYNALIHETDAHLSLPHLQGLVKRGLWGHAVLYLSTYLPPNGLCFHAYIFHNFLRLHHGFAKAVAGYSNEFLVRQYVNRPGPLSAADLALRATVLSILAVDPEEISYMINVEYIHRAAMDWERVRTQAVSVVHELAHSTPDLRCSLKLPAACIKPHHALPLASSSSSRLRQRHLINKKVPPQQKTRAIISALKRRSYVEARRASVIGSSERAKQVLLYYIEKTLEAGLREGCSLSVPTQPSGRKEGSQTMCGPLTLLAKNPKIISVKGLGAESSQMMSGTFTDPAKSSRISCATNAGCYTERAYQNFSRRKNPRDEPTTVEEDRDRKRNRTTGEEFDEASLVSIMTDAAGAVVAHPSLSTPVNLSA